MSSQRSLRPVGDQELALLQFIAGRGRATVAEAVQGFGQPRGLARSTVLTMMERLRKKGHLGRRAVAGVYHYTPRTAPGAAVRQAVRTFVDRTLGGSISPFVAYLADRLTDDERLTDQEVTELETLVTKLQRDRRSRE